MYIKPYSLLALVLLVPISAIAQQNSSSVTLYGNLDASMNFQRFSGTATQASSSHRTLSSDTSRFGLRGSEDLGGGMRAYFKLESGFNIDTGAQSSPTAFWNRESIVGLSHSSLGSVQMGSQFTPSLWLTAKTDPFGRAASGAVFTLFQQGGAAGPRGYVAQHNNAIQYLTPNMSGFVGRLMVASSEGVAPFGNPIGASIEYADGGRLFLGAAYDRVNVSGVAVGQPALVAVKNNTYSLGATYKFDYFKLHGYYINNKIDGATGMNGYQLGVTVPIGSGEMAFAVQQRNVSDAANSDARLIALRYTHFLSKRTSVYVSGGRQTNRGNATFGIWPARVELAAIGPAPGQAVSAISVGIKHTF